MPMPTALEIARVVKLKPIADVAQEIGIPPWLVQPAMPGLASNSAAERIDIAGRRDRRTAMIRWPTGSR